MSDAMLTPDQIERIVGRHDAFGRILGPYDAQHTEGESLIVTHNGVPVGELWASHALLFARES